MIASCKNNKKPQNQPATQQAAPQAAPEADPVKTEDRAWYTVDIPTSWEAKQYVSEMTVRRAGAELNFKEQANSDINNWIENINADGGEKSDAISTGDITWNVFKNVYGFKTLYVAQVKDGVVRVGSTYEDPNHPDAIKIIETVKAK